MSFSHSLSISQTGDEWFISLPAIILPFSLQPCFLKYACPTFFCSPLSEIKWMSFALAFVLLCNPALFVVDPISRSDPSCSLETGAGECLADRQTQQAHQPASINASALPGGVPTHSYENSLSLLFFEPNSASFFVICSRRMEKRADILYATHFLLLHCTIYSTVHSDEITPDSAIVSSIHLILAGRKKNNWQFHHGQKSGFSHILSQESRDADCVFIWPRRDIMTWSISAKCIWKTEKDLFRRDWMP